MSMDDKSLADWLRELENRNPVEILLGLDRISKVAAKLSLNSFQARVITVAGTNGKGSTVALLESIYHHAGYKVAAYTSPHLINFTERIRVSLQEISASDLISAFELIEKARGDINLSYFEMATLAAFWYFKQQAPDLIILEVGLGGRLDATNIIDSDLAIITTIAHDHEAFLGSTLEKIGLEKAGILRANKALIYADFVMPVSIFARAEELKVSIYQNSKDYSYQSTESALIFYYQNQIINLPKTSFHPNSMAAAVMASLKLQNWLPLSYEDIYEGIKNTRLAGRLQLILNSKCLVLLDVAHNVQAAAALAAHLKTKYAGKKIHAVFSAFADKDLEGMIMALRDEVTYWYPSLLPAGRAASSTQILTAMKTCDQVPKLCYNGPVLAYVEAYRRVLPDELIVVFGSFITVSCVLSFLSQSHIKEI